MKFSERKSNIVNPPSAKRSSPKKVNNMIAKAAQASIGQILQQSYSSSSRESLRHEKENVNYYSNQPTMSTSGKTRNTKLASPDTSSNNGGGADQLARKSSLFRRDMRRLNLLKEVKVFIENKQRIQQSLSPHMVVN